MHKYQPDIVILNTGYAQVENLGPIIMGKEDVLRTHNILPKAHIISTYGICKSFWTNPKRNP